MHPFHFCVPESALFPVGAWLLPAGTKTCLPVEALTTQCCEKSCMTVGSLPWGQIFDPVVFQRRAFKRAIAVSSIFFLCRHGIGSIRQGKSLHRGWVALAHQRATQGPWAPQAAEGRLLLHVVSIASGELLEASTWLLQKAAQDEASSVLLWRSEVSWWTRIFLPPWPCTWFSPFANYQIKHSNKSSSPQRQVPLQSRHPNAMEDAHVPELNHCTLTWGHILFSFLLFPATFDVLACSAVFSDDISEAVTRHFFVCLGFFFTLLKTLGEVPELDF